MIHEASRVNGKDFLIAQTLFDLRAQVVICSGMCHIISISDLRYFQFTSTSLSRSLIVRPGASVMLHMRRMLTLLEKEIMLQIESVNLVTDRNDVTDKKKKDC